MDFQTPITTREGARAYLLALVAAGVAYHIEDRAADIVRPDGSPLFTPEQAAGADIRADECAALLEDPCAVLLDAMAEDNDDCIYIAGVLGRPFAGVSVQTVPEGWSYTTEGGDCEGGVS